MIEKLTQNYAAIAQWLNESQRGVGVAIFLLTLALGWSSGIFSTLRRKPKFKLQLINGPTFVCTFSTGKKYDELDVHRTGVALYLKIANVGFAASSIERISGTNFRPNAMPCNDFTRQRPLHSKQRLDPCKTGLSLITIVDGQEYIRATRKAVG
jgi:hypothetical protein